MTVKIERSNVLTLLFGNFLFFGCIVYRWNRDIAPYHYCGTQTKVVGYTTKTTTYIPVFYIYERPILIVEPDIRIDLYDWNPSPQMDSSYNDVVKELESKYPRNATLEVCLNKERTSGINKWLDFSSCIMRSSGDLTAFTFMAAVNILGLTEKPPNLPS